MHHAVYYADVKAHGDISRWRTQDLHRCATAPFRGMSPRTSCAARSIAMRNQRMAARPSRGQEGSHRRWRPSPERWSAPVTRFWAHLVARRVARSREATSRTPRRASRAGADSPSSFEWPSPLDDAGYVQDDRTVVEVFSLRS